MPSGAAPTQAPRRYRAWLSTSTNASLGGCDNMLRFYCFGVDRLTTLAVDRER